MELVNAMPTQTMLNFGAFYKANNRLSCLISVSLRINIKIHNTYQTRCGCKRGTNPPIRNVISVTESRDYPLLLKVK
jgi:hypothetical protein